jgi:hypothetical protein
MALQACIQNAAKILQREAAPNQDFLAAGPIKDPSIMLIADYFADLARQKSMSSALGKAQNIEKAVEILENNEKSKVFKKKIAAGQLSEDRMLNIVGLACSEMSAVPKPADKIEKHRRAPPDAVIAAELFLSQFKHPEVARLAEYAGNKSQLMKLKVIDTEYDGLASLPHMRPLKKFMEEFIPNGSAPSHLATVKSLRSKIRNYRTQYAKFNAAIKEIKPFIEKGIHTRDKKLEAENALVLFPDLDTIAAMLNDPQMSEELLQAKEKLHRSIADYVEESHRNSEAVEECAGILLHTKNILAVSFANPDHLLEHQVDVYEKCSEAFDNVNSRMAKMPDDEALKELIQKTGKCYSNIASLLARQKKAGIKRLQDIAGEVAARARQNRCETHAKRESLKEDNSRESLKKDVSELERIRGIISRLDKSETAACTRSINAANEKIEQYDSNARKLERRVNAAKRLPFAIAKRKPSPDRAFLSFYKKGSSLAAKLGRQLKSHAQDDWLVPLINQGQDSLAIASELLNEKRAEAGKQAVAVLDDYKSHAKNLSVRTSIAYEIARKKLLGLDEFIGTLTDFNQGIIPEASQARTLLSAAKDKYWALAKARRGIIREFCDTANDFELKVRDYFTPANYTAPSLTFLRSQIDDFGKLMAQIRDFNEDPALRELVGLADKAHTAVETEVTRQVDKKMGQYRDEFMDAVPDIDAHTAKSWKQVCEIAPLEKKIADLQKEIDILRKSGRVKDADFVLKLAEQEGKIKNYKSDALSKAICKQSDLFVKYTDPSKDIVRKSKYEPPETGLLRPQAPDAGKMHDRDTYAAKLLEAQALIPIFEYVGAGKENNWPVRCKKTCEMIEAKIKAYDERFAQRKIEVEELIVKFADSLIESEKLLENYEKEVFDPTLIKGICVKAAELDKKAEAVKPYCIDDALEGMIQKIDYYRYALENSLKDYANKHVDGMERAADAIGKVIAATGKDTLQEIKKLDPLEHTANRLGNRYEALVTTGLPARSSKKRIVESHAIRASSQQYRADIQSIRTNYEKLREKNNAELTKAQGELATMLVEIEAKGNLDISIAKAYEKAGINPEFALSAKAAAPLQQYLESILFPIVTFKQNVQEYSDKYSGLKRDEGLSNNPFFNSIAGCEAYANMTLESFISSLAGEHKKAQDAVSGLDKTIISGIEEGQKAAEYLKAANNIYRSLGALAKDGPDAIMKGEEKIKEVEKAAEDYTEILAMRSGHIQALANRFSSIQTAPAQAKSFDEIVAWYTNTVEEYSKSMEIYWSWNDWKKDRMLGSLYTALDTARNDKTIELEGAYKKVLNAVLARESACFEENKKIRSKNFFFRDIRDFKKGSNNDKEISHCIKLRSDLETQYRILRESNVEPNPFD